MAEMEKAQAVEKSGISFKGIVKRISLPTLIIAVFWIIILILGVVFNISLATLLTDTIKRFGMNGIMVLAMVPAIQSGTGPNFALPMGICCGLLAEVCAISFGFESWGWVGMSILLAVVFGGILGYVYGHLLNMVKGSEMTIATYTGFSFTALMMLVWLLVPFGSSKMNWFIGGGLRSTIQLDQIFAAEIFNNLWGFTVFGVYIPTGMLLFFFLCCFLVWLFFRSKAGVAISAGGINPMFARASGLNVDRSRILANMVSTILGAVGIVVYSQSFGYTQLYDAPLMMAFPAVAAVLIGGATAQRAKVIHVIVGTLLFQGLLTTALPVFNSMFDGTDLSEILRMIIQNGIILYALTQVKGGGQ